MHISWLGGTTIKLQSKPVNDDVVVVIDPYKPTQGDFPRSLTADIVLATRGEKNLVTLSGSPFLLDSPGECETKNVLMTAATSQTEGQTIVRLDTEQLSIGHLGLAQKTLNDDELDVVSGVDILFVPVGGADCYDAEMAVKVINSIEPRIVIPMAYKSENDPNAANLDIFLRAIGVKAEEPQSKVIIKKKDLPTDDMKVIILEKE